MKKFRLKVKKNLIINGKLKLIFITILFCNVTFGQVTKLKADNKIIIDESFINSAFNPYGTIFNGAPDFLIEFDSNKLYIYNLDKENLKKYLEFDIILTIDNMIIFNNLDDLYDRVSIINNHNLNLLIKMNIDHSSLEFYYIEKESKIPRLVCQLNIIEISFNEGWTFIK